jgi:hypothetical protein
MALNEEQLRQLVSNPTESLAVELKNWIDPEAPEGKSKIIKSVLAMRNHDGGFLLIGFNNSDCSPIIDDAPSDVEEIFHVDKIQGLISRFTSEKFEIAVYYPEIKGQKFVVIEAPSGIKAPVATKSVLTNGARKLVGLNKVYVRSLNSNNTPSTTEATWKDWPNLMEKCFENKEADIGRFIRRHLTSVTTDEFRKALFDSFATQVSEPKVAYDSGIQPTPDATDVVPEKSEHTLRTLSPLEFMEVSHDRYEEAISERGIFTPPHGAMEVSATVSGSIARTNASSEFLNLLNSNNPRYTGWPMWVDSRGFSDKAARPYVLNGVWEALIVSIEQGFSGHLDFWRLSPEGQFYQYRALQDDISGSSKAPKPGTALDFGLAILRVAECIAVAIEFAKAMGCEESTIVKFIFRWTGLKDRQLSSWVDPFRFLSYEPVAFQNQISIAVDVPTETAKSALYGFVHQVVSKLFIVFEGYELSSKVTEDFVERLLERKL